MPSTDVIHVSHFAGVDLLATAATCSCLCGAIGDRKSFPDADLVCPGQYQTNVACSVFGAKRLAAGEPVILTVCCADDHCSNPPQNFILKSVRGIPKF